MAEEIENLNSPNEEKEPIASPNDQEEQSEVEAPEEPADDTSEGTKPEQYTEREKQLYAQLQKAKGFVLRDGKWVKPDKPAPEPTQVSGLTATDAILIAKSNVEVEDVERVVKFAKDEGITISQALGNSELKAILAVRSEERKTASITHTTSPRGITKTTGEDLLKRAEKTGEMPETDDGMRSLAQARLDRRKNR